MRVGFEARKGKTGVLLLHGLSGTPSEVKPLGDFLAAKGYSTLGPWLKGHGTSPKDLAATRWQDWSDSAREALAALGKRCDRVFVGGLSMGADQALHLAAHYPVAGVLSLAAPIHIPDFRFNGIAFFRFLQWRTSNLTGGVDDPSAPAHETYPFLSTQSLYELKKLMDHLRDDLPFVTCPALVVQGRKDSMVAPENGRWVYEALGSKLKHLVYLERSNHVIPLDYDREILFAKALGFLKSGGRRV
ncbi:MAG TPA: alpha/beta fold hydrolase [bacterium]|nr:alpha/beta fold hydrolase [bacterium]